MKVQLFSGNTKASEMLAYLQTNKLVCESYKGTGRRLKTPGSETKDSFIYSPQQQEPEFHDLGRGGKEREGGGRERIRWNSAQSELLKYCIEKTNESENRKQEKKYFQ